MSLLLVPCHRRRTRIIYYIYGFIGGFYRSTMASPTVRRVWWTLNTVGVLCDAVGSMSAYLLTTSSIHVTDLLYVAAITLGVLYTSAFIPLVTYHFHDRLSAIIRDMNDEFDCPEPRPRRTDIARTRFDSVTEALKWVVVMTALIVMFCGSSIVYLVVYCDDSCLRNPMLYVQATPFTERVRSTLMYAAINVVQGSFLVLAGSHASCAMAFGLIAGYELRNVFANLGIRLAHLIEDTATSVNTTARQSDTMRRAPGNTVDSEEFDKFKVEMAAIVKRYQKLSRAVETLRPWIQLTSSINLLSIFLLQTPFAYLVLVSKDEPLIKIRAAIGLVTVTLVFYASCLLGEIFEDTNQKMISDVYSTAWYTLPPGYRKMVHIFQGQVQQPMRFFAILIYPITMVTFMRSINLVYTVISLVRHRQPKF